jgi:pantoate--beta-alanine ligase
VKRVTTIAGVRAAVSEARRAGRTIVLVPTMGGLHEGHLAHVRTAAERGDDPFVVVSVFVNPAQFAPGEDFESYPRDLEGDEDKLRALGASAPHLVFAPDTAEMYPQSTSEGGLATRTTVHVSGLTAGLCGVSRPGHFEGVCTAVAKLFNQVAPDAATFGRKDFQQLQVVRAMVADLDVAVEIVAIPTVREADGVAMSSRNSYLCPADRAAARALSRALARAVLAAREARASGGYPTRSLLLDVALATIGAEPRARVDYVEVVDPETLEPPDPAGGQAPELLVAIAAHVGPARLIDNVVIGDPADEERLLGAVGDG